MSDSVHDGWFRIGDNDFVAEGQAVEMVVAGRVLAVFRHAGQWYAIDGMCAHQGGPIAKGTVEHGCVTCPWHGWQYELATGKQTIHGQKLLDTYPTKAQAGGIWIRIDHPEPKEDTR